MLITLMTTNFLFKYIPDSPSSEKRVLKAFPKIEGKDTKSLLKYATVLPGGIDAYFNDRFSFRNGMVNSFNTFKLEKLGQSPSATVIKGSHSWFFLTFLNNYYYDYYYCKTPYTFEELNNIKNDFVLNKEFVNGLGATYYPMLIPNKDTVYKEYLPRYQKDKMCEQTRAQQLVSFLNNSPVDLIYPLEELRQSKQSNQLYYKTDSHWNQNGAFVAYNRLMSEIKKTRPEIKISTEEDFTITNESNRLGDLAEFMSVPNLRENSDGVQRFLPNSTRDIILDEYDFASHLTTGKQISLNDRNLVKLNDTVLNFKIQNPKAKNQLTVVLFRDSYAMSLVPFLYDTFSEVYFFNPPSRLGFDRNLVIKYKPDIVVQEFLERKLISD
ncbi:MAG: DHHW family protein [bacterium]